MGGRHWVRSRCARRGWWLLFLLFRALLRVFHRVPRWPPRPSQEGSWGSLDPSSGDLGLLLVALGPSFDGLGGLWVHLEGGLGLLLGTLGPSWSGLGGPWGYQRVVLGLLGMRFVDSIHRFDPALDRSIVLHHIINSIWTQQLGPAECTMRLNPPPAPQGRVQPVGK